MNEVDLRKAISTLGFDSDGEVIWSDATTRLYSRIQTVELQGAVGTKKFLLKSGGNLPEKNINLNRVAEDTCAGSARLFQPKMALDENSNTIVTEFFDGASLSSLLRYGLFHNPFDWQRRLVVYGELAGDWLRRFHCVSTSESEADVSASLVRYVEAREDRLDCIPGELRDRYLKAIQKPYASRVALTHGDYAPHNLLISGDQLCVIDFGVSEWAQMLPSWDYVSLLIGVRWTSMFSVRSLVRWVPSMLAGFERSFVEAYGGSFSDRDLLICTAIRHLTTLAVEERSDHICMRTDSRTKWQYQEFCKAMDAISAIDQDQ